MGQTLYVGPEGVCFCVMLVLCIAAFNSCKLINPLVGFVVVILQSK